MKTAIILLAIATLSNSLGWNGWIGAVLAIIAILVVTLGAPNIAH